jgi:hypothetical protein
MVYVNNIIISILIITLIISKENTSRKAKDVMKKN